MNRFRASRSALALSVLLSAGGGLRAEEKPEEKPAEAVFLSLTRTEEPMDKMPSNISVITQEDIQRSGAKTLDEALEGAPGVTLARSGGFGSFTTVRLRGVPSSAEVQVLVDDRPVGGVSTQFTDLSQIPVDDIERIEIVRGASSVLYGANTLGGVIHVITKRKSAAGASTSIGWEARSFGTRIQRGEVGLNNLRSDVNVNASHTRSDGLQENGDFTNTAVSGNAGHSFQNGARVDLDLSRENNETGNPQGTLLPPSAWNGHVERAAADPSQRIAQNSSAARFKAAVPAGPLGLIESTFYGSDQTETIVPRKDDPASFDQREEIAGDDTRLLVGHGLTLGASFERDRERIYSAPQRLDHVMDWGVYAQEQVTLGRLDLIPAARFDRHSDFKGIVNPRVTAVYRLSSDWKVSADAARSFRAPSFLELFYQDPFFHGNENLRPEKGWTYDLGAELKWNEDSDIRMTGFYSRLTDRIAAVDSDGDGFTDTYANAARAEITGAEWEARHRYTRSLVATSRYTYTRALGNSPTSSSYVPLLYTPRHRAEYALSWEGPRRISIDSRVQYVNRQFEKDGENGVRLPSYTVWDARLTKRILAAELFFGVDNILNRRYAESAGVYFNPVTFVGSTTWYPQPARTFRGGVSIRFAN